MSNSNNFYSRDPFGVFQVGNSSSGGNNFGGGSKPPMSKIIITVLFIAGIAAVLIFQDAIGKFFFGETPKKKIVKPTVKQNDNAEVAIKITPEPETENYEEGTGATIVE